MAERALLAHHRADGRYDLFRSRWGGTDRALATVLSGVPPTNLPGVTWRFRRVVGTRSRLATTLDYLSTAVVYCGEATDTMVFLPLWFGLPLGDARPSPGFGALVAVQSLSEALCLRAQFRRLKGALTDAILAESLPSTAAPLVVRGAVATLEDRECYVAPPRAGDERLNHNG